MNDPTSDDKREEAYRYLNEGARLLRSQRYTEALEPLEAAYELLPDNADVAITYGGALVIGAKWRQAVSVLETAVEQHPDNSRLWLNLAAAYLGRLEISSRAHQDQAITAYTRALEIDPNAHSAHYNVGLIYAERKEWEEATEWFQQAIRANPNDTDAIAWLKKARTAQNKPADAGASAENLSQEE